MQWQDIPGFSQYQVSDSGEILSYHRGKPRQLKVRLSQGRAVVSLYQNGKQFYTLVGPLILTIFVGPKPLGMECCHWDGNPMNNRISNLRWDTHQENVADSIRHGTFPVGSRNGRAKLIESDIALILRQASEGIPIKQIARNFGIDPATVRPIIRGDAWKHAR